MVYSKLWKDWCQLPAALASSPRVPVSTADSYTGPDPCVHLWRNDKPGGGPHQGTGNNSQGLLPTGLNRNTRPRAKELAPSRRTPGPWPMVGSHPGLRAGSWRKLGTCPRPAADFIGGLDIPTPNHSHSGSRNTNLFKVSGAGQARPLSRASAAGIPEPPETWAVASAFSLASNWLEGPSFRRAESAIEVGSGQPH